MKRKTLVRLCLLLVAIVFADSRDSQAVPRNGTVLAEQTAAACRAEIHVSQDGVSAITGETDNVDCIVACATRIAPRLEDYLFTYVDEYKCPAGATCLEFGSTRLVGTYGGRNGKFPVGCRLGAKCAWRIKCSSIPGAKIICPLQQPHVKARVKAVARVAARRLELRENIKAQTIPYRGRLRV